MMSRRKSSGDPLETPLGVPRSVFRGVPDDFRPETPRELLQGSLGGLQIISAETTLLGHTVIISYSHTFENVPLKVVKFMFSEKATKFEKISQFYLKLLINVS